MKETVDYKYDQLFQQFGAEIVKVGRVYLSVTYVLIEKPFLQYFERLTIGFELVNHLSSLSQLEFNLILFQIEGSELDLEGCSWFRSV